MNHFSRKISFMTACQRLFIFPQPCSTMIQTDGTSEKKKKASFFKHGSSVIKINSHWKTFPVLLLKTILRTLHG